MLGEVSHADPNIERLMIAYLQQTEASYKQTQREVKEAHDMGMTDPGRLAAKEEKGHYFKQVVK